jgi:hypothetical protein
LGCTDCGFEAACGYGALSGCAGLFNGPSAGLAWFGGVGDWHGK